MPDPTNPAATAGNQTAPVPRTERRILSIFTRTPLHVGAGESVGAIDQPIQRERHTGFPIIPGSTLKGVFADEWTEVVDRPQTNPDGTPKLDEQQRPVVLRVAEAKPERNWLFGRGDGKEFAAGALQFGEARLLAFPIRSAKGSFAWITCPLMLRRAIRDGALQTGQKQPLTLGPDAFKELQGSTGDDHVLAATGTVTLEVTENNQKSSKVVLEEYTFTVKGSLPSNLTEALENLLPGDEVWCDLGSRLIIVSDGMMSFFATTACEVAQHVTIDDVTGTAKPTGLFNQENVPSEAFFYSVLHAFPEMGKQLTNDQSQTHRARSAESALDEFYSVLDKTRVFQFGADATTGLGFCTVRLAKLLQPTNPDTGGQGTGASSGRSAPAPEPQPTKDH